MIVANKKRDTSFAKPTRAAIDVIDSDGGGGGNDSNKRQKTMIKQSPPHVNDQHSCQQTTEEQQMKSNHDAHKHHFHQILNAILDPDTTYSDNIKLLDELGPSIAQSITIDERMHISALLRGKIAQDAALQCVTMTHIKLSDIEGLTPEVLEIIAVPVTCMTDNQHVMVQSTLLPCGQHVCAACVDIHCVQNPDHYMCTVMDASATFLRVRGAIDSLQIKCNHEGCDHVHSVQSHAMHVANCKFMVIPCKFLPNG